MKLFRAGSPNFSSHITFRDTVIHPKIDKSQLDLNLFNHFLTFFDIFLTFSQYVSLMIFCFRPESAQKRIV